MRLINADVLAEILANRMEIIAERYGVFSSEAGILCGVYKLLQSQLTIEPELYWIPCSEETGDGYPEEDGFYYVTEQNYGFYLDADCKQRVAHTSHFKNGDFTDRFYTENNSNITAWCKLPEPYRAERGQE